MKNSVLTLTFCFLLFCSWFSTSGEAAPKMKIYQSGNSTVGLDTKWPESHKVPSSEANGKYKGKWLTTDDVPVRAGHKVLKTWTPSEFTSLTGVPQDQEFESFNLVVHGFELRDVVRGIDGGLDLFVKSHLKPSRFTPLGVEFIPFYPYFFHKKTIVSASIVTEKNTATFGRCGLVLSVPEENYIAASKIDMHSPLDSHFYQSSGDLGAYAAILLQFGASPADVARISQDFGSGIMAYTLLKNLAATRPLIPLSEFLPKTVVDPRGTVSQGGPIASVSDELKDQPPTRLRTDSWYNEVAFSPIGLLSPETRLIKKGTDARIVGLFFRADNSPEGLARALLRRDIELTLELGEIFDLPVVQIYDGQYYETDVGSQSL